MNAHLEKTTPEHQPQSGPNLTTSLPSTTAQIPAESQTASSHIKADPKESGLNFLKIVTRRGKIARFPNEIREQLNCRLRNYETSATILPWINAIPAVQKILESEFGGKPVRSQNISEWRKGGYREWLNRQEAMEAFTRIAVANPGLLENGGEHLTETVSLRITAQYVMAAEKHEATNGGFDWKRLRETCNDVVALRRRDQISQRMTLDEERNLARASATKSRRRRKFLDGMDALRKFVEKHPDAKSAYEMLCSAIPSSTAAPATPLWMDLPIEH